MEFNDQREQAFLAAVEAMREETEILRNTREARRARRKIERMCSNRRFAPSGLEVFLIAGVLGGAVYGAIILILMKLFSA